MNFLDNERLNKGRSKPEKHAFALEQGDLFKYAGMAAGARAAARPAPLAAVLFLGTRARNAEGHGALEEHAIRFASGVADGAELSLNDPRLTLRQAMYGAKGAKGGVGSLSWAFAATAHAWNAFAAQRQIAAISVRSGADGDWVIPPLVGAPEQGSGVAGLDVAALPPAALSVIDQTRARWHANEERASAA
jgi:hypothetical protein